MSDNLDNKNKTEPPTEAELSRAAMERIVSKLERAVLGDGKDKGSDDDDEMKTFDPIALVSFMDKVNQHHRYVELLEEAKQRLETGGDKSLTRVDLEVLIHSKGGTVPGRPISPLPEPFTKKDLSCAKFMRDWGIKYEEKRHFLGLAVKNLEVAGNKDEKDVILGACRTLLTDLNPESVEECCQFLLDLTAKNATIAAQKAMLAAKDLEIVAKDAMIASLERREKAKAAKR